MKDVEIPTDDYTPFSTIMEQAGYNFESHEVITEDGYILTMHRVNKGSPAGKKPILLNHGLFSNSEVWCVASTDAVCR